LVKKSQNSRFADKSGTPVPNPAEFFLIRKIPALYSVFDADSNEPIVDFLRRNVKRNVKEKLINYKIVKNIGNISFHYRSMEVENSFIASFACWL
jgi:hypothetical protein